MKNKKVLIPIIILILAIVVGAAVFFVVSANSPEKKLTRQLDLGAKYLSEEDYKQAIAAFDVAISIDPKNVDAYLGKAEAYIGLEDYESAIDTLVAGYDETEDKRIKKELKNIVEEYVEELVDDGDVDKAIELMQDIQDDIDDEIFDEEISDLEDSQKKEEPVDDVPVDATGSEIIEAGDSSNIIESDGLDVEFYAYEWEGDYLFEAFPEAMWNGGLMAFNMDSVDPSLPSIAYICCGEDILNAVGMYETAGDGHYIAIKFSYSYMEESAPPKGWNGFGDKATIFHDAEIIDLTYFYVENVGGDTFETMILQEREIDLIKNGEVVGWNPLY